MQLIGRSAGISLLLLCWSGTSLAQAQPHKATGLVTGVGLYMGGGPGTIRGSVWGISLGVETRLGVIAGRLLTNIETLALIPDAKPVERNSEAGALMGWPLINAEGLRILVMGGVATTTIIRRGEQTGEGHPFLSATYEELRQSAIGFPVEVRFQVQQRDWGGGFLAFVANVNEVESFAGVQFGLFLRGSNE